MKVNGYFSNFPYFLRSPSGGSLQRVKNFFFRCVRGQRKPKDKQRDPEVYIDTREGSAQQEVKIYCAASILEHIAFGTETRFLFKFRFEIFIYILTVLGVLWPLKVDKYFVIWYNPL